MITIHHLNDSRSHKIIWLMEELGEPYDIKFYQRHPATLQAPPEMKALHPMGKSPTIEENGQFYFESGAILDYILRHHGKGKLHPPVDSPEYDRFVEWLHYAEGSGIFPIMLKLFFQFANAGNEALDSVAEREIDTNMRYLDQKLAANPYLMGDKFSAVDLHVVFIIEIANKYIDVTKYAHVWAWAKRLHNRPAFGRALEVGGAYIYSLRD